MALLLTGLVCGAAGWWLRGSAGPGSAGSPGTAAEEALPSASAAGPKPPASPRPAPALAAEESPAAARSRVKAVVERMFNADLGDAVEMMEKIGSLTRLSDAEVRLAWEELLRQNPHNNAGTSFASLYLWGRMMRMGENVPVPDKWGAQDFQMAIEAERARRDRTNILARLQAGEAASETERRVVFTELLREDPLGAIKLWCRVTQPGDYQREARWLGEALTNPDTRAAIMAQLRAWQKGGDLGGTAAALAKDWMSRDPAAVEQWLKDPAQADVREAVLSELITARAVGNASETWDWAKSLSEDERRQALDLVAPRLAISDPDAGLKLLSELTDPDERQQALKGFAYGLAGDDYSHWQQWRETLPAPERDLANEAAFPYWVNQDVSKAVEWLGTRPAGEAKDLMITSLVFYYAERDPQTSAQWIRTISDLGRRREAVTAALSNVGPEDLNRVRILLGAMEQ